MGCITRITADSILSIPRQSTMIRIANQHYGYQLAPPAQRAIIRASASDATGDLAHHLPRVALRDLPRELTLHTQASKLRRVELGANRGDLLGVAAVVDGGRLTGWLLDLRTGEELSWSQAKLIGDIDGGSVHEENAVSATRRLVRALCSSAYRRTDDVADVVISGAKLTSDSGHDLLRASGAGLDPIADAAACAAVAAGCIDAGATLVVSVQPFPWVLAVHARRAWLAAAVDWDGAAVGFAPLGKEKVVERVSFVDDLRLQHSGDSPSGIGLGAAIDCTAELRRAGVLDERGKLAREKGNDLQAAIAGRLSEVHGKVTLRLSPGDVLPGVEFRQAHVTAVQRLRAAMMVATRGVLTRACLEPEDLDRVVLVGDSAHWGVRNATDIGLLPDVSPATFRPLPDAVSTGARLALLSAQASDDIRSLAEDCERMSAPQHGGEWAEELYLHLRPRPQRLDASEKPLLSFGQRSTAATDGPA